MSRVYSNNLATNSLSLVFEEALEPSEAPRVESALGFPTRGFAPSSDVGEVLHNDGCSLLNAMKDRSGKNVVAILPESLLTTSEASKMPFGGLSAFGLQSTLEAQILFRDFCHMPIPVESVVRGDSGASNPKVNSNSLPVRDEFNIRDTNYDVKIKLVSLSDKVGGCCRATSCILGIFGKLEGYLHPTARCGHTDNAFIPIHLISVQVVARRAGLRLRAGYFATLLYQCVDRLQGLRCLSYCLYVQVRDKRRQDSFARVVSNPMQVIGVGFVLLPAKLTDAIKRLGKLLDCLAQSLCLFGRSQKPNPDSSIHRYIIPYQYKILQLLRKEVWRIPLPPKGGSPLRPTIMETRR
jgi:hypothetical protein